MHGFGLLIHLVHVSGVQYLLHIVLALYGTVIYVSTTLTLNATPFFIEYIYGFTQHSDNILKLLQPAGLCRGGQFTVK
jgi:hypothetical protein